MEWGLIWGGIGIGAGVLGLILTAGGYLFGAKLSRETDRLLERMDTANRAQHTQTQGMLETMGRGFREDRQGTRDLMERLDREHRETLDRMDGSTKELLDRMDRAAEQRQAELKAILDRRAP